MTEPWLTLHPDRAVVRVSGALVNRHWADMFGHACLIDPNAVLDVVVDIADHARSVTHTRQRATTGEQLPDSLRRVLAEAVERAAGGGYCECPPGRPGTCTFCDITESGGGE